MGSVEGTFRTAVVGGFNRQDVLNYIEARAREHRERCAALQKTVDEERRRREEAETGASAGRERIGELEDKLSAAEKQAAGETAAAASLREELEQLREELEKERRMRMTLERELQDLQARAERWELGAKAYDELKDRTATIELEAHQRARGIERTAEEQAERVRAAAERLLGRLQAGYSRLRSDVDATIVHAGGEIGRVEKALEQARSEFAEHDQALEELLEACRDWADLQPDGAEADDGPAPCQEKEES